MLIFRLFFLFFVVGWAACQDTTSFPTVTDHPLCGGMTCDEDKHCEVKDSFCWLGIFCLPQHSVCVDNCQGVNEIWEPCSHCEQKRICGEELKCVSTAFCDSQCVCDFGYIRDQNGSCILESTCPSNGGRLSRLLNM